MIAYLNGAGPFSDRDKFPLPGVLLLDLKMPNVSGFEVLEWWKSQPHLAELVIVVVSGNREMQEIARAYQLGARSFISKPLSDRDLMGLARTVPAFCISPADQEQ